YSGSASGASVVFDDVGFMTNAPPFTPVPPGATNSLFNTNVFLNRTNFFPGTRTPFNPDKPSTFPKQNQGNSASGNPTPSLPPPMNGNSPWSPQFASPDTPQQLPIQPQPNPWSPRFNSPDVSGTPLPVNPQANPWGPRFP